MAKPACVTYSTGRWSHKEQPFGGQPGNQNGKSPGYNSAGQVLRMTDVLIGGAPWWRSWQTLSCEYWLRTPSTVRKPLSFFRWSSECVCPLNLFKQLLLYALPCFPTDSGRKFLFVSFMNTLQNMPLTPLRSGIQFIIIQKIFVKWLDC